MFRLFLLLLIFNTAYSEVYYGFLESTKDEVNLLKGDALVVLSSTRNQSIDSDDCLYVTTPSGIVHKLSFIDLNSVYARTSTYENKSYGFGMATTSTESRTVVGPASVSISSDFYLAYKVVRANNNGISRKFSAVDRGFRTNSINTKNEQSSMGSVVLEISKDDVVHYAGKRILLNKVYDLIKDIYTANGKIPIVVKAHVESKHRTFSTVYDQAMKAGANEISFYDLSNE